MKRLIVGCDGTWRDLTTDPTNVVKMVQAISPSAAGVAQIVYYDAGIGVDGAVDRWGGGIFGWGLDKNIQEAYRFLCLNYEKGDEIYLFGFSRGAYTVRSLAGLLHFAGILSRKKLHGIPEAYDRYSASKGEAIKESHQQQSEAFREEYASEIPPIALLGCWDTVGALGIPDKIEWLPLSDRANRKYQFHDLRLGSHIRRALHALAIDEKRKEFLPTLMEETQPGQLQQVWFPGDHSSVGGGSLPREPLANAAFLWMCDRIQVLGLGLTIDPSRIDLEMKTDHRSYVDTDYRDSLTGKILYQEGPRELPEGLTLAGLHDSVLARWRDCPWARSQTLEQALGTQLDEVAGSPPAPEIKTLQPGESAEFVVLAKRPENDTGIDLQAGSRYEFEIPETQLWQDGNQAPCDANGWRVEECEGLPPLLVPALKAVEKFRRSPQADWLELIGILKISTPDGGDREEIFSIVREAKGWVAPQSGRLSACANDLPGKYDNNRGWLFVRVRRLS